MEASVRLSLILAVVPVIFLLKFIYKHDKEREPKKILSQIFFTGILSVIPVIYFEKMLESSFPTDGFMGFGERIINVFVGVALVEEFWKFIAAYIYSRKNKEFNHRYDAIVYCAYGALAFALVEDLLYIIASDYSIDLALKRMALALPSHLCYGIIMGYFYGISQEKKYHKQGLSSFLYIIIGLVLSSSIHALYDAILFQAAYSLDEEILNILYYIDIGFVIAYYIICFVIVKMVSKHQLNIDGTAVVGDEMLKLVPQQMQQATPTYVVYNQPAVFCTKCGNVIEGNFCAHCGNPRT